MSMIESKFVEAQNAFQDHVKEMYEHLEFKKQKEKQIAEHGYRTYSERLQTTFNKSFITMQTSQTRNDDTTASLNELSNRLRNGTERA